jgi:hypothetical protein
MSFLAYSRSWTAAITSINGDMIYDDTYISAVSRPEASLESLRLIVASNFYFY